VKTIKDAFDKQVSIGAAGVTSTTAVYPSVLKQVTGVKFRMVLGYAGSAECMLAMERGEVEGHTTGWDTLKSTHPDWIADKKVNVLVQHALARHPELPDVPTSVELARNPEEEQLLRIVANATEIGKSVLAPPGIPADRAEALRRAFDATVVDPEFVADVKAARFDVEPMTGEALQKLVAEVASASPEIIEKVRAIYPME
jgi:tripartite-type tricarboxylate transporter receptor subunit TctC